MTHTEYSCSDTNAWWISVNCALHSGHDSFIFAHSHRHTKQNEWRHASLCATSTIVLSRQMGHLSFSGGDDDPPVSSTAAELAACSSTAAVDDIFQSDDSVAKSVNVNAVAGPWTRMKCAQTRTCTVGRVAFLIANCVFASRNGLVDATNLALLPFPSPKSNSPEHVHYRAISCPTVDMHRMESHVV